MSSHQHKKSQLLAEVIVALMLLALGLSCLIQQIQKRKTHPFKKQVIINSIFEEDMKNGIALTFDEIDRLHNSTSEKEIAEIYERAEQRAREMRRQDVL